MLMLRNLHIGKVDGKHEYLTPHDPQDRPPFDAFMMPGGVDPAKMNNADICYIEGFRGTGKTSLLRWHAESKKASGAITDFVLFKTDLTETQRQHISSEVGISWTDVDPNAMEIAQDFKEAWCWFILHKIGENIKANQQAYISTSNTSVERVLRLLGLCEDGVFKKALGFMPKLEGARVKIRSDLQFFQAELEGDFRAAGAHGTVSLDALSKKILARVTSIVFSKAVYIYFDELEAFYHTPEQHRRDLRMVRDLLFAISTLNEAFRKAGCPLHLLAAVRSEVVDAMGSLGEEVDRLVHDKGFLISWHHANKSTHHPLLQIIAQKINLSESSNGLPVSSDPLGSYFPSHIGRESIDTFLLDKSFYKPRDIVWRLSIAQKLFPNETRFTVRVLHDTETEYSAKLWDEVRYELSATYSDAEVDAIESVISGGASAFDLRYMEDQFSRSAQHSATLQGLLSRKSVREILSDLYRLGAVGNSFRIGSSGSDIRDRWYFRGDPTLLPHKRMVVHRALLKRLSVVATRKRGSRPDR